MITKKTLSLKAIYRFSGQHLIWLVPWMLLIAAGYYFTHWRVFTLPWLPLSLVGTAVAFYVGFKNNQSYDRLWEARKIWGAIINNSRILGTMIKHFQAMENKEASNMEEVKKQFIYRHIAYVYQLRSQLLEPTAWEHGSLAWIFGSFNRRRQQKILKNFHEELDVVSHQAYLSKEEKNHLISFSNIATHLLDKQTEVVQKLFQTERISAMQQIELQRTINNIYEEQGKAERIKKFPLPRQYGGYGFVFVCIFVFLLPFGIVGEFSKLGDLYVWLSVPVGVIIGWIYVAMEMIGDYSENPFEGLPNDIPMLSICRTIEIDLLQMIGEKDIPKPIGSKDDILF
ncbi:MAG TPA: bestrophin family ion channel [Flavipsychrobacter sp.]|nr:bestrophin family ion channel [Flavipsychrobacter sp.]